MIYMFLCKAAVRLVAELSRLSGVTYCLIATMAVMVLLVGYQTFTPYNRN